MELPEPQRSAVEARILELPKTIGMISFRELVPVMARQVDRYPHLRLLAREALAAASILGARVLLKTAFPTLEAVLAAEGLEAQHVA